MAIRPVYIPELGGPRLVRTENVSFDWSPGFSKSQSRKSIDALHRSISHDLGLEKVLEISTRSPLTLGVSLSAFNLKIETVRKHRQFVVESAYQGSKVFEHGGPYRDLLSSPPREAKKDLRISQSGRLLGFHFLGIDWPLEPRTAFYDWLYVNALRKQTYLLEQILHFEAFTDIAFNPEKSINCQAHSAALCVSLYLRGLLSDKLATKESFLQIMNTPIQTTEHSKFMTEIADMRKPIHSSESPKASRPSKGRVPGSIKFSALEFPYWDSVGTLTSLLSQWQPEHTAKERDLEESLYKYLKRELPEVLVQKQFREGPVRADLAIADCVLIEVKKNLNSQNEYQRLCDQLKSLSDWEGNLILLLTGNIDPRFVSDLRAKINALPKDLLSEPKVTIVRSGEL